MTVHVYSEISNQSKSETYKPYIIGLIGLAISKEAWFIHKPLDRSHSYAAVFTALYTTWYELKEIFLAAKTCYIIAMHVTLHETSKTYSGSKTMHVSSKTYSRIRTYQRVDEFYRKK